MKKNQVIAAIVVAAIVVFVIFTYVSHANYGNAKEELIVAQDLRRQNVSSRVANSILEAVQVTDRAQDGVIEVIKQATEGRYGLDGANNVVLAIQEAELGQVDPQLYFMIQTLIRDGRTDFEREQTLLIDRVADYRISLGNVWSGFWLRLSGHPSIKLDDYKPIIDETTAGKFESGRDAPLQLGN